VDVLVSLVGAGPGDPALLTLAAVRALARADVVLFDPLVHPAVLARARPGATLERVDGHEGGPPSDTASRLVALARRGSRVCRLYSGDPFVTGPGADEAAMLARECIPYEIVPGVPVALGASAYAGIPLLHPSRSRSVAFVVSSEAGGHDWSRLATSTETLVLSLEEGPIERPLERLVQHGRPATTPAAVIQSGTRAEQRVVLGTVDDLAQRCDDAGIEAPVILVVGEVARLREALCWRDRAPLFGRRILVTRASEQAGELLDALAERGAEPVHFPAIEFVPPSDTAPLAHALREIERYDLVLFTSANGVRRFFAALREGGRDARALGRSRVVAVGPATAAALEAQGICADAVPSEFVGEAVADTALALLHAHHGEVVGRRVLLARAEVAREVLPARLRAAGVELDVVPVYRTVPAAAREVEALRDALLAGQIDAITFTSSSTVEQVCAALGERAHELLAPVVVASIGPIASAAARRHGLHVTVEAEAYTIAGLLTALEAHYVRRNS
jgi:uroporphyrinogen III methyltransferase/synthase